MGYNKYFKKPLLTKFFGADSLQKLFLMIEDTVEWKDGFAASKLSDADAKDFAMYVKLTEEARRFRESRLAVGDESVKLNFSVMAAAQSQAAPKATSKSAPTGWQSGTPTSKASS